MTQLRPGRRLLAPVILVLVSLLGGPAAAGGTAAAKTDAAKTATIDADLERFDFEVDTDGLAAIKLRCRGSIADEPVVGCSWRAPDDAGIAGFQLWNLQTAPTEGVRNLVAELGADTTTYRDGDVTAPATYLYVVLGLDADGEIVARSRVDRARLGDPAIERLRLTCDGLDVDDPAVGCGWSGADDAPVASYVLYRNSKGEERAVVATLGADATRFTDTTVECGVRYRYKLVGLDAVGEVVATSRPDAAGCGERDHERTPHRDARAERTERTPEPAATVEADTVVAAMPDQVDDVRPAEPQRHRDDSSDRTGVRRERGR